MQEHQNIKTCKSIKTLKPVRALSGYTLAPPSQWLAHRGLKSEEPGCHFYDADEGDVDEDGGDTGDDNDDGGGDNCFRIDDDLEDWMGGLPGLSSRGTQRVRRLAPRIFLLLLCSFLKSLYFIFYHYTQVQTNENL